MLDILKSSAAGAPGSLDDWTVSRDWMKTLLIRLSPQQLANAAQQLDEILAGPIDQRVFLTFAPVLQEMLPRLSAEQRRAMAGRLFTLVRPSAAWQNFARQSLRWWIAVAVRDFNARETEDCLQPFQLLEETAAKVSATEVLANVLCLHAPQMSAEQAAHWTKLLMLSLDEATSSADLSAERSSVVSFTLGALAPRLSQPDRAALGQQLQTLLNKSENPLPSNAIFLDTILQTVPVLPPELILRIRSELLTAATAELPQSDLLQPALMLADIHSQLLATIIKNTAPSEDTAILDELAAVLEKSPDSGHTSAILAAAFKELASRGDAACVQRIWKITLPILQNQTWGIAYRMTEGPARMFKLAPEEFNEWQQKKFFFSQQIGGLLAVLTERLTPAQAGAAWDDLLGLLKIQAPAGMLSEWNHTRAEICSTALTNLATQIPPSECGQRLKDLIMAARFELTQQSRTMLDSTSHGYSLLSSVLGALAGRTSPDSAREAAVWLKENASQHHPVTLSLAWQAIIPQLPTGTLREFEEHLFHCATLNDGSGLGPHPWLELSLRTGPDALSGRWRDILRLLQTAENRETTEQLCELLMVCVNHVSPAERKLAIQPLLGRLEESLRLPEASEQQLAAFGLDVFRSVLQGRPEASVHDAIIRLSEGLDADSRKELAERCIEVTLRCDADEDWWLLFRETNFPGGVCGDAQQLLKHLGHPNCEGWIGESLLRRFEELLLHGGQPILKVDDAGSKVLALKPDSFKQPQRTFTAPTEPWPKTPPRRFRDVTAAVTWVENHRPEWKAGGVQP
jgi:hypothetical protein